MFSQSYKAVVVRARLPDNALPVTKPTVKILLLMCRIQALKEMRSSFSLPPMITTFG
jgi:hypothetical protein